jgi:hypothetical protein
MHSKNKGWGGGKNEKEGRGELSRGGRKRGRVAYFAIRSLKSFAFKKFRHCFVFETRRN